ncbi:hypothetical protein GFS60_04097 [Rhodococcus sp. WAY2]|nr:hypothetical protein GFS60_04097 [Rhodococcus sp. WAY2]
MAEVLFDRHRGVPPRIVIRRKEHSAAQGCLPRGRRNVHGRPVIPSFRFHVRSPVGRGVMRRRMVMMARAVRLRGTKAIGSDHHTCCYTDDLLALTSSQGAQRAALVRDSPAAP